MEKPTAQFVESLFMRYTIPVLDKGFCNLEDFMGGDLRVVNAARVSNAQRSETFTERDAKLIRYLLKHKHTSPFEHTMFTFHVKLPFFVRSEWQRHRTWKFNEISGRYVEFGKDYPLQFYIPKEMRVPAASNKQGSAQVDPKWAQEWYESIAAYSEEQAVDNWNQVSRGSIEAASNSSAVWYDDLANHKKVAKELSRIILPLNTYTEMYATIDAHNLMNFLDLRNSPDAQWEIQEYARALESHFKRLMPYTYEAWTSERRTI